MPDITATIRSKPSTGASDLLVDVNGIASTLRDAAQLLADLATENANLRSVEDQLIGDSLEVFGKSEPAATLARAATEVHLGSSKAWPIEVHFPALGRFAARLSVTETHTLIDQLNRELGEHAANGGLS